MSRVIHVVNPCERDWKLKRFVLWFGACSATRLMVWGYLDDALEVAADWLLTNAPGHVMKEWSDEHKELVKEVCQERGIAFPEGFFALLDNPDTQDQAWDIDQEATADLTRTESGFLTSYEWGIDLEDPTREELMGFARDIDATFVYGPEVK